MAKLDWIPLYIHRLKASKRWQQMQDFERGWYISLLIESADSERPGYLPDDPTVLWRLAGAKTMAYFQREGQSVLACFDRRTDDGRRWIYNSRLVQTIAETIEQQEVKQVSRKKKKAEIYIGISSLPISEIYNSYPRRRKKKTSLKAIEKAILEIAHEKKISELDAAEFLHKATLEFAKSPAGNNGIYTPYSATWFNSGDYMSDRSEWYRQQSGKPNGAAIGMNHEPEPMTPEQKKALEKAVEAYRKREGITR